MPSIHHHKKTMLRAILVTLGVFSLPFSALASTDCFFRLSPSKYSLSEVRPEIDYLESVIPGFGTIAQQYAIDTVHFYLPRTRNAKSVIKDLAYTLQFIERNPQEGWNNELRYRKCLRVGVDVGQRVSCFIRKQGEVFS